MRWRLYKYIGNNDQVVREVEVLCQPDGSDDAMVERWMYGLMQDLGLNKAIAVQGDSFPVCCMRTRLSEADRYVRGPSSLISVS